MSTSSRYWKAARCGLLVAAVLATGGWSAAVIWEGGTVEDAVLMLMTGFLATAMSYVIARMMMLFRLVFRRLIITFRPRSRVLRWPLFRIFVAGVTCNFIGQFFFDEATELSFRFSVYMVLGWLCGVIDLLEDRERAAGIEVGKAAQPA